MSQPSHVQLRVYDVLGHEVVIDAAEATGTFQVRCDGRDASGRRVASGVYLYRLILGRQPSPTRVMTLLK